MPCPLYVMDREGMNAPSHPHYDGVSLKFGEEGKREEKRKRREIKERNLRKQGKYKIMKN